MFNPGIKNATFSIAPTIYYTKYTSYKSWVLNIDFLF